MKPVASRNVAVLLGLVAVLVLIKLFDLLVAPNHIYPGRVAQFAWAELVVVAVAGLVAAILAARTATVTVLPPPEGAGRRLVGALLLGGVLGAALAALDAWLRIGDINVGLPLAPLFYLWGAISQEVLTHFAPVAIVLGLASFALHGKGETVLFWIVALLMAGLAAASMVGAFQNPDIPLHPQVAAAPILIGAAVFAIELALFGMFRVAGFLAALSMRLGFYAIWHVAWPALTY